MIILSAAKFEAIPLLEILNSNQYTFLEIGIGPLNSSRNFDKIKQAVKNQDVLFFGSCGIFGTFKTPELVTSDRVVWLPTSERLGFSDSIAGLLPPIKIIKETKIKDLKNVTTLCCSNISLTAEIQSEIIEKFQLQNQILIENLELYSLVEAFIEAKSVSILLVITNEVCKEGRIQWKSNQKEAYKLAANYAKGLFT